MEHKLDVALVARDRTIRALGVVGSFDSVVADSMGCSVRRNAGYRVGRVGVGRDGIAEDPCSSLADRCDTVDYQRAVRRRSSSDVHRFDVVHRIAFHQ
jgi:hypothetical protein